MVRYISSNQNTSSLIEREQFFKTLQLPENTPHVLLQTCDRVELYWGEGNVSVPIAHHLFSVVSGLESSLIGECAIQGQVKNCYQDSSEKYNLSSSLHLLFQTALSVGKRVRTDSAISQGAISHSQAVIECLIHEKVPLKNALITLLGVNKLNEDIIKFLHSKGAFSIFLGNRYFEKAQDLAAKYNCKAFQLDQMQPFLDFTDVLITATSAPHLIVKPERISLNQKILILDLAFPRDVDESIGLLPNVTLYNLDDIKLRVNQNKEARVNQMETAFQIIDEEVEKFCLKSDRIISKKSIRI
jgi:glutamyl-tRNA reductase